MESVDSVYFALKPREEIGGEIISQVDNYYHNALSDGWLSMWRRSYEQYYKGFITGGEPIRTGHSGELTKLSVNHYRNLLRHILVMTTSQKSVFEPRAINNDYQTMAQTILAQNLLDYYLYQEKMNRYLNEACEYSLVYGEGFVVGDWNANKGQIVGAEEDDDEGKPVYSGDLEFYTAMPLDVIRDYNAYKPASQNWFIVRSFVSRYDYAKLYPDLSEKILGISSEKDTNRVIYPQKNTDKNSDQIPLYTLYHKKSPSLPEGRLVKCFSHDTVLIDTPLPYDMFPVFRITPAEQENTPFGYTDGFDMLALQRMYDSQVSTIASNQSTFGVQNVVVEKGTNISSQTLAGGLNLLSIERGSMAPQPLNLTQTPPEIFNFKDQLGQAMETMSGVNSVTRGQPEASLRSGSALALVQSMAIEYNSYVQKSYAELMEDVGTFIISTLKRYADAPRVAEISGKSNKWYMKEWSKKDLSNIQRVIVDMGNPLSKTIAGRTEMAQNLLQNGMVKTPEQFMQVMQTGRLEPVIEGDQAELMLIKDENEHMSNGKMVQAIMTDNHNRHIMEHKVVLSSMEARENPMLVKATLAHIQEHMNLAMTTDPNILMALQQQPPMPTGPGTQGSMEPISKQDPNNMGNARMPEIPQPAAVG
jgi:hypothetical protein